MAHAGAGNHFYIQHGNEVAGYAHMQKGTLNSKLLAAGAKVTAGDVLGLAGNSGNASEPHLHIHAIKRETTRGRSAASAVVPEFVRDRSGRSPAARYQGALGAGECSRPAAGTNQWVHLASRPRPAVARLGEST